MNQRPGALEHPTCFFTDPGFHGASAGTRELGGPLRARHLEGPDHVAVTPWREIPAIFEGPPTAPGGELHASNYDARQTDGGPLLAQSALKLVPD